MAQIIKESFIEEHVEHSHVFDRNDNSGSGWGFPCSETGEILPLEGLALENYQAALQGVANGTVIDRGVQVYRWSYRVPTVAKCVVCRKHFEMGDAFLNTCSGCGTDYDGAGRRLAPRSQWGEETDESLADILSTQD